MILKHRARRMVMSAGLLLMLALLGGCVAPAIVADRKLTGEDGAVVLKFIPKGALPTDPVEQLTSMFVREQLPTVQAPGATSSAGAASARVFELNRTRLSTHSTMVLSGILPPGRYSISHMIGKLGNTTYTFPLGAQLPLFEVKAKNATLLGTILVQPGSGNLFDVAYVAPDKEFHETLEQLYPALAAQARETAPPGFEKTELLNRRSALAPNFRLRISALNGLTQSAEGTLYAGTRTGIALMRRSIDQRWRAIDVRSWREVMSLRPYRDGIVVAGEESLLKFSRDEGRTWVNLKAPDTGLIYGLEPTEAGFVLAVTRYRGNWTVYRSTNLFDGAWQKLGEFETERSFNVLWATPRMVAAGNRIGLMMPNGTYHLVDGVKGTIEQFPGTLSVLELWAMPDGRLVQRGTSITAKTVMSEDFGRTWVDVNIGRFAVCVVYRNKETIYAVSPVDPGITAGAFGLMTSRDAGKTWSQSGVVPGGNPQAVRELMIDRVDGALLAILSNATVMRSIDEGKTWVAEGG